MATLLTRRALTPQQLAILTSEQEQDCRRFIDLLHGFRLLVEEEPAAARSVTRAPAPASGGWDLVRSIRRRLGL